MQFKHLALLLASALSSLPAYALTINPGGPLIPVPTPIANPGGPLIPATTIQPGGPLITARQEVNPGGPEIPATTTIEEIQPGGPMIPATTVPASTFNGLHPGPEIPACEYVSGDLYYCPLLTATVAIPAATACH